MKSILRYELDNRGEIGITLEEFDSLSEMDLFMQKFSNSNDVKEKYFDKINTFLQDKKCIDFLNTVTKENNGYLRGYARDKYKNRLVPLIFNSKLLSEDMCYSILRKELEKYKVLQDIYNHKYYILPSKPTLFLKDELRHAVVHHGTKKIFIKEFIKYLEKLSKEERYFVLRVLCDKCNLLDNPKKKWVNNFKIRPSNIGKIKEYSLVKVRHYPLGDFSDEELNEKTSSEEFNLRDGADDEFAMKSIEDLLKEYDLDEIDRNTDYFDNKGKTR